MSGARIPPGGTDRARNAETADGVAILAADTLLECGRCGWLHAGITRAEAEAEIAAFNAFYARLSPTGRMAYRGAASLASYEACRRCGAPARLARSVAAWKAPRGITLLPLVAEPGP